MAYKIFTCNKCDYVLQCPDQEDAEVIDCDCGGELTLKCVCHRGECLIMAMGEEDIFSECVCGMTEN